jgi:general secretion pathway protein A
MYQDHYNFKQKPFEVAADPQFIWFSQKHAEAVSMFQEAIQRNNKLLVLIGDVGTGKTTFLKYFLKKFEDKAAVAMVPDPAMTALDFINYLSAEFNMAKHFKSPGDFLFELTNFLRENDSKKPSIFLAIDESHHISFEFFQIIRALFNLKVEGKKLIHILLVGQAKILKVLQRGKAKAAEPTDHVRCQLDPLTKNETQQYIQHRLKIAGSEKEIFTQEAIPEIYSFSLGYPTMINIICDRALLTGYVDGLTLIDKNVVTECAKELSLQSLFKKK